MKKRYNIPHTEVFAILPVTLMESTAVSFDNAGGGGVSPQDKDAESDAMSRQHSGIWDDD